MKGNQEAFVKLEVYNYIRNNGSKKVPVQTSQICWALGLRPRELRNIIRDLREQYPIVSKEEDGGGYWIAKDNGDIEMFVERITRRKKRYEHTIRTMKKHLK